MPQLVVSVDRSSDDAVYLQIARRIRAAIATGELATGAPLPAVRSMASDLGINLNTVARAYRLLEDEGFVEIRERTGAVVAPPASRARSGAREALRARLAEVLAHMRQSGIPVKEIEKLAAREIAALGGEETRG